MKKQNHINNRGDFVKMAEEFDYRISEGENEKAFENKLLDGHFNYFADVNFWFMKQLPDKIVKPSGMKNHIIGMSDKTYQKYLKFLEQIRFIQKERYGTYVMKEQYLKCLQKYTFVIYEMHHRTYNPTNFTELMEKAKPKKEEEKVEGEKKE